MPKQNQLPFSIIIPTRNRAHLLQRVLTHLAAQNYPTQKFEVIVVDNDPQDNQTLQLVKKLQPSMKNLKYLSEPQRGASPARNAGSKHAKFPHLIFIDDDVVLTPQFLVGYERAWTKYPKAKILGGSIDTQLGTGVPLTTSQRELLRKYPWVFAHKQFGQDLTLSLDDFLFSANMSYRLSKQESAPFTLMMGVQLYLDDQVGGEDFELCARSSLQGQTVVFVSDADVAVTHQVSPERFHESYIFKRHVQAGIEMYILEKVLKKQFPTFTPFYLKNLRTLQGLKLLATDKYARTMLFSYLLNGKYYS